MSPALGLLFLQGYVATPRALAELSPAPERDLVDRIADAIALEQTAAPMFRNEACPA